jgi:hypothetical protein
MDGVVRVYPIVNLLLLVINADQMSECLVTFIADIQSHFAGF